MTFISKKRQDRQKLTTTSLTTIKDVLAEAETTNFDDTQQTELFQKKHSAQLNPTTRRSPELGEKKLDNVLHTLCSQKPLGRHTRFVQWLIESHPALLDHRGREGRTPLYAAIKNDNLGVIKLILDWSKNAKSLLQCQSKGENCLQLAIVRRNPLTNIMIKKFHDPSAAKVNANQSPDGETGSSNIFTSRRTWDGQDMTPLHFAVCPGVDEDEDCYQYTDGDLDIVKSFDTWDRRGLADVMNGDGDGVFINKTAPETDFEQDTEMQEPEVQCAKGFQDSQIVNLLIEAQPRVLVDCKDSAENTPFQARLSRLRSKMEDKGVTNRDDIIRGDEILSNMREYIIERFNRRDAMKALYKVGEERALEFDLSGLPYSSITPYFLNDLGECLKFEQVLNYVALPRLTFESSVGSVQATTAERKAKGVSHMCHLFKWLRDNGVLSIMRVSVIDNVEPSHSDAAIENCLKQLSVRILDWYKLDLCSDVIAKSAPNIMELTLYSSGNNAVLKGWSSPSGLARLCKLRRVHVVVNESLETQERLEVYMKEFEEELKRSQRDRPDSDMIRVTYKLVDSDEKSSSILTQRAGGVGRSRWMKTMGAFAMFLQDANKRAGPDVKPVKIAIIDDGINTKHDIFAKRIGAGDSFYQVDDMSQRWVPFYVPSGPHGTHMAKLICQVCPVVKLHIAQLEVLQGHDGRRSFNHASAAEAIRWAIDQDVDIISMSWSIKTNQTLNQLHDALQAAADHRIVMFCAAIDEGPGAVDNTYPGRAEVCIKVGASSSMGARLSWVSESTVDFLLPGDLLLLDSGNEPAANPHSQPSMSGSSVSTALAAGLAGVLLYCDRLVETEKDEITIEYNQDVKSKKKQKFVDSLRAPGRMKMAFMSLRASGESSNFIQVWDHWDPLMGDRNRMQLTWDPSGKEEETLATKEKLKAFMDQRRATS